MRKLASSSPSDSTRIHWLTRLTDALFSLLKLCDDPEIDQCVVMLSCTVISSVAPPLVVLRHTESFNRLVRLVRYQLKSEHPQVASCFSTRRWFSGGLQSPPVGSIPLFSSRNLQPFHQTSCGASFCFHQALCHEQKVWSIYHGIGWWSATNLPGGGEGLRNSSQCHSQGETLVNILLFTVWFKDCPLSTLSLSPWWDFSFPTLLKSTGSWPLRQENCKILQ